MDRRKPSIETVNSVNLLGNVHESLRRDSDILSILALAVEQSPISIVITDLSGTVQFVNPAFTKITGYTPEETLGGNSRILKTELNPPELHKTLWETIIEGRIWEGEFVNRKKDGEIFIELAKITPIKNRDGEITHYIAFKEDISARKRVEQEIKDINLSLLGKIDEEARRRTDQERLLANQARMVAMGEMIGAIAHQWRQPLATLAMIVQRMHAVGTIKEISRDQLDDFKTSAMRQIKYMSDTIEEFRGYYDKDKITESFSPYRCITDAIQLFEPQFTPSGIRVEIKAIDVKEQQTIGFPNEFKQVILNLLGNARDAIMESRTNHGSPENGLITIDITVKTESMMIIDIGDNGCGIQENVASRIFDPYFTTKENQMGTGIGLYMSRMLMQESLGGSLNLLKSKEGATFRIKLPLKGLK